MVFWMWIRLSDRYPSETLRRPFSVLQLQYTHKAPDLLRRGCLLQRRGRWVRGLTPPWTGTATGGGTNRWEMRMMWQSRCSVSTAVMTLFSQLLPPCPFPFSRIIHISCWHWRSEEATAGSLCSTRNGWMELRPGQMKCRTITGVTLRSWSTSAEWPISWDRSRETGRRGTKPVRRAGSTWQLLAGGEPSPRGERGHRQLNWAERTQRMGNLPGRGPTHAKENWKGKLVWGSHQSHLQC